jgi:polyhydroxybutyrate depolymerase
MPSRRVQWSILAFAVALAGVLTLGAWTPPAPRARAAEDCRPAPGNRLLGDALVHVPPHPTAPLPLVIAFHGSHGYGPSFPRESGLSETADHYGFAVLYPTAGGSTRFWSLNRSMHPDDVALLRALLPQAEAAACVDRTRIYATGVSNGGGFTARVGCEMSDTIAAIAPVAGGYKALDPCPDGHRTSVLEIHGDADRVVPFAMGKELFEAAPGPKRFLALADHPHVQPRRPEFFAAVRDFLAATGAK